MIIIIALVQMLFCSILHVSGAKCSAFQIMHVPSTAGMLKLNWLIKMFEML